MLIKLGALLISQEKPYMSTVDEVPERFPVKIAFTRKLNEQELTKLAIYALMVENGVAAEGGIAWETTEKTASGTRTISV